MITNYYLQSHANNYDGSYRGILFYDGSEARVFIPTMYNSGIKEEDLEGMIDCFPIALFASVEMKQTALVGKSPCYVIFENGDLQRPIITGYFGNGIRSIGGSGGYGGYGQYGDAEGDYAFGNGSYNGELNSNNVDIPKDCATWTFPFKTKTDSMNGNTTSAGWFGAPRNGGARAHAGLDLFNPNGTEIIACTSGTVIQTYYFYTGSGGPCDAMEVVSDNNKYIIRYGEIQCIAYAGAHVNQGDVIAKVKSTSMLHIEVYANTVSGGLTDYSNPRYEFVPQRPYNRRSDLLDPSFIWSLQLYNSYGPNYFDYQYR